MVVSKFHLHKINRFRHKLLLKIFGIALIKLKRQPVKERILEGIDNLIAEKTEAELKTIIKVLEK